MVTSLRARTSDYIKRGIAKFLKVIHTIGMRRIKEERGFTLMELLIVVAVLAIMAAIAMPKFAGMLQKAQEGALKGNLGTMRSALSIYYSDQGQYPVCPAIGPASAVLDSLVPAYIKDIPPVKSGLHPPVSTVYCDAEMVPGSIHDSQGWYYDGNLPEDAYHGGIWVACDHGDSVGREWTTY
jgi:prepilin-type N-terminal cleavage/methylation domain-containing protein